MKVVVLSDTHIPFVTDSLPKKVIDELKNTDVIIHVGDFIDLESLKELKRYAPVEAVYGNMDSYELKGILPKQKIIQLGKFFIGLIHGDGASKDIKMIVSNAFKGKNLDMIIYGHTHVPITYTNDGIVYLNPGSPTDTLFAPYNSYAVLNIEDEIQIDICRIE